MTTISVSNVFIFMLCMKTCLLCTISHFKANLFDQCEHEAWQVDCCLREDGDHRIVSHTTSSAISLDKLYLEVIGRNGL